MRFVRLITLDVNGMARPPITEIGGDEVDALRFGAAAPWVHDVLLPNLAMAETDPKWKEDIVAAALPKNITFQSIGVQNAPPRSAAGLAQDILDIHAGRRPSEGRNLPIDLRRKATLTGTVPVILNWGMNPR